MLKAPYPYFGYPLVCGKINPVRHTKTGRFVFLSADGFHNMNCGQSAPYYGLTSRRMSDNIGSSKGHFVMDEKYINLFWEKVDKSGDCWLWTGATNEKGYGIAWDGERTQKAHRFSYMLAHGKMPALCVLHHCDNPPCVRPDHLFLGTRNDNNQDMVHKGRHVPGATHLDSTLDGEYIRGVEHHAAKVNPDIVRAMRREYAAGGTSYSKLAKKYGLALGNAWRIINKVTWKHVE